MSVGIYRENKNRDTVRERIQGYMERMIIGIHGKNEARDTRRE